MEDENVMIERHETGRLAVGFPSHIPARSVLGGILVGLAVGGPLFGMMGFSFLASTTLLLVSSPLLLLFSPLLLSAALVLAGALAGFGAAALMAVAGMSTLGWVFWELGTLQRFHPEISTAAAEQWSS
ncbi:hypothetical protein CRG98_024891 [Punica granatum]|nr:hypothetical protein CRG98_024891 [Punica granatum]